MNACERPEGDEVRSKPDGGFTPLSVTQIAMIWTAYLVEGLRIGLIEVRVYLAAHELVQTRKTEQHTRRIAFLAWKKDPKGPCPKPVVPHYDLRELAALVGEPTEKVSRAVARLEASGLLSFTPSRIAFAVEPEDLRVDSTDPFYEMLRKLSPASGWKRFVPVPRRILRVLAETGSRSLLASVLGFTIRCCWYFANGKRYTFQGRCKSSWIADCFSISLASTKAMRAFLVSIEFLRVLETSQAEMNEKGGLFLVNPEFDSSSAPETERLEAGKRGAADELLVAVDPTWHRLSGTDVADLARQMTPSEEGIFGQPQTKLEPISGQPPAFYKEDKEISSVRHKDQEQASCPEAGKAASAAGDQESWPAAKPPGPGLYIDKVGKGTENPPETWGRVHITAQDLRDTGRVLDLYELSVSAGVLKASDHAELKFMGFVERARLKATANPGGFLRRLVEGDLAIHITDSQWETARRRLLAYRYEERGDPGIPFRLKPPPEREKTPKPKDPAAEKAVKALEAQTRARREAEENLDRRVSEFWNGLTTEEKETHKARALAEANWFLRREYQRCLKQKNEGGARLYLDAAVHGLCEKIVTGQGKN
jgi:hypothetical protein